MSVLEELIKLIESHGLMAIVSALFLWAVIHSFKEVSPKLDRIEESLSRYGQNGEVLHELMKSTNEALTQMGKSTDNVAHSLDLLRSSFEVLTGEVKETKEIVKDHDDLGEKIFTAARVNGRICDMILTNQTTRKRAAQAVSKITASVEKEVEEERGKP